MDPIDIEPPRILFHTNHSFQFLCDWCITFCFSWALNVIVAAISYRERIPFASRRNPTITIQSIRLWNDFSGAMPGVSQFSRLLHGNWDRRSLPPSSFAVGTSIIFWTKMNYKQYVFLCVCCEYDNDNNRFWTSIGRYTGEESSPWSKSPWSRILLLRLYHTQKKLDGKCEKLVEQV